MHLSFFRVSTFRFARATTHAALLITVALAGACGSSDASPTQPGPDEVVIRRSAFSPSARTVASGTRVTWSNQDGEAHTVTGEGPERWDSGVLTGGNAYSRTFTTPGTYRYSCSIHPEMRGSITVGQAAYQQSKDGPAALLAVQRP